MRGARESCPLAYIDEPLARNCLFYQRCLPERAGQPWRVNGDLLQSFARQPYNQRLRDRADGAVHAREQGDAQVTHIPRHAVGHDLPPPVRQELVTARKTFEEGTAGEALPNRVAELFDKAETKMARAELARLKKETDGRRRAEARIKGYEGDSCGSCGNFTLVRNGTCMKCDTCGSTSGCS